MEALDPFVDLRKSLDGIDQKYRGVAFIVAVKAVEARSPTARKAVQEALNDAFVLDKISKRRSA